MPEIFVLHMPGDPRLNKQTDFQIYKKKLSKIQMRMSTDYDLVKVWFTQNRAQRKRPKARRNIQMCPKFLFRLPPVLAATVKATEVKVYKSLS